VIENVLYFSVEPDEATSAKRSVDNALQMYIDDVDVVADSAKQQNSALCPENLRQNLKLSQTMARTENGTTKTDNVKEQGTRSIRQHIFTCDVPLGDDCIAANAKAVNALQAHPGGKYVLHTKITAPNDNESLLLRFEQRR